MLLCSSNAVRVDGSSLEVVEIKGYDPDRDEYDFAAIFQSEREPL